MSDWKAIVATLPVVATVIQSLAYHSNSIHYEYFLLSYDRFVLSLYLAHYCSAVIRTIMIFFSSSHNKNMPSTYLYGITPSINYSTRWVVYAIQHNIINAFVLYYSIYRAKIKCTLLPQRWNVHTRILLATFQEYKYVLQENITLLFYVRQYIFSPEDELSVFCVLVVYIWNYIKPIILNKTYGTHTTALC